MLLAQPLDKAVDKEAQLCQQFALPTAWSGAVRKASARFWGKAQLCQQPEPKLLAKLARLVGKAQLCQQPGPKLLAKLARLVGKAQLCQ
jgi:hypothetical protein